MKKYLLTFTLLMKFLMYLSITTTKTHKLKNPESKCAYSTIKNKKEEIIKLKDFSESQILSITVDNNCFNLLNSEQINQKIKTNILIIKEIKHDINLILSWFDLNHLQKYILTKLLLYHFPLTDLNNKSTLIKNCKFNILQISDGKNINLEIINSAINNFVLTNSHFSYLKIEYTEAHTELNLSASIFDYLEIREKRNINVIFESKFIFPVKGIKIISEENSRMTLINFNNAFKQDTEVNEKSYIVPEVGLFSVNIKDLYDIYIKDNLNSLNLTNIFFKKLIIEDKNVLNVLSIIDFPNDKYNSKYPPVIYLPQHLQDLTNFTVHDPRILVFYNDLTNNKLQLNKIKFFQVESKTPKEINFHSFKNIEILFISFDEFKKNQLFFSESKSLRVLRLFKATLTSYYALNIESVINLEINGYAGSNNGKKLCVLNYYLKVNFYYKEEENFQTDIYRGDAMNFIVDKDQFKSLRIKDSKISYLYLRITEETKSIYLIDLPKLESVNIEVIDDIELKYLKINSSNSKKFKIYMCIKHKYNQRSEDGNIIITSGEKLDESTTNSSS